MVSSEINNKRILRKYFYKDLLEWLRIKKGYEKKIAIWGTGAEATTFIENTEIEFDFFIETNPKKKYFMKKNIFSIKILKDLSPEKLIIIICSEFINEIEPELINHGFINKENYIYQNYSKYKELVKYTTDEKKFIKVVEDLNKNCDYIRLNSEENSEQYNWLILIKNNSLDYILNDHNLSDNKSKYIFNFKWVEPIGFQEEFLYFPLNISEKIFDNKSWHKDEFWDLNQENKKLYSAYQELFHKSNKKIKINDIKEKHKTNDFKNKKYEEIFSFLQENNWIPPISDIRRWAEINNNNFLKNKSKMKKGYGFCFILTIRESGNKKEIINQVKKLMIENKFKLIKSLILNKEERMRLKKGTRGGCWFENNASKKGGGPAALLIFIDKNKLNSKSKNQENSKNWRNIKELIRKKFIGTELDSSKVNWIHSSDDHFESLETINLLEENKKRKIYNLIN